MASRQTSVNICIAEIVLTIGGKAVAVRVSVVFDELLASLVGQSVAAVDFARARMSMLFELFVYVLLIDVIAEQRLDLISTLYLAVLATFCQLVVHVAKERLVHWIRCRLIDRLQLLLF